MKRTKIVATIGPASTARETLKEMILEGVNVVRLNFSHGEHEIHKQVIDHVRSIDQELGRHTSILADLQGPKLRTGEMEGEGAMLETGSRVVLTTKTCVGTSKRFSTNYEEFARDVKAGERVLLDDGKLALEVVKTNGKDEVT